jgi:hypothetical protein
MTDEEILAHYRIADPYISLAKAKELHRIELKFGHLGRIKKLQEQLAQEQARRELRERLFGVQNVDDADEDGKSVPSSEQDRRLRAELAVELGWYPVNLDDESIAQHRTDAARKQTDRDPAKKWAHLAQLQRQLNVEAARRAAVAVRGRIVAPPSGGRVLLPVSELQRSADHPRADTFLSVASKHNVGKQLIPFRRLTPTLCM